LHRNFSEKNRNLKEFSKAEVFETWFCWLQNRKNLENQKASYKTLIYSRWLKVDLKKKWRETYFQSFLIVQSSIKSVDRIFLLMKTAGTFLNREALKIK